MWSGRADPGKRTTFSGKSGMRIRFITYYRKFVTPLSSPSALRTKGPAFHRVHAYHPNSEPLECLRIRVYGPVQLSRFAKDAVQIENIPRHSWDSFPTIFRNVRSRPRRRRSSYIRERVRIEQKRQSAFRRQTAPAPRGVFSALAAWGRGPL